MERHIHNTVNTMLDDAASVLGTLQDHKEINSIHAYETLQGQLQAYEQAIKILITAPGTGILYMHFMDDIRFVAIRNANRGK